MDQIKSTFFQYFVSRHFGGRRSTEANPRELQRQCYKIYTMTYRCEKNSTLKNALSYYYANVVAVRSGSAVINIKLKRVSTFVNMLKAFLIILCGIKTFNCAQICQKTFCL
jgi:hypothetical protein